MAHRGQLDDSGCDYFIAHLDPVAHTVWEHTRNYILTAAAYLHDTIEDDIHTTYETLEREFGEEVAGLVDELTHRGSKDNKGQCFPKLKTQGAIIIKFADRLSNISRMDAWGKKRRKQYLARSVFWKDGTEPIFKTKNNDSKK